MAEITFDEKELNEFLSKGEAASLILIGEFSKSKMISLVPRDTNFLAGQIDYQIIPRKRIVRTYANTEYAAIQELGGDIVPDQAGALTVPVHPDAKGKSAKDFDDLVLIKRNNAAPLLVRKKGRGFNHERLDVMFVLVQRVTITPQPYMRPVLDEKDELLKLVKNGFRSN